MEKKTEKDNTAKIWSQTTQDTGNTDIKGYFAVCWLARIPNMLVARWKKET